MRILSRIFGFDVTRHRVSTEIIAGLTTFLAMAYILAVNPAIFSALKDQGMDPGAVFTATALAAVIGTLLMAVLARLPFALAPGMGINAFFVYTVCLGMGHTWQFALTAVFLEGLLFIVLTLLNIRTLIVRAIPESLKLAIGVGIGLFIAFIGLRNAGIIVHSDSTLVTLGQITGGSALLGLLGLVLSSVLMVLRTPGALLWGILLTTVLGIPMGLTHFDGVISLPPGISGTFLCFEWEHILSPDMLIVVFTMLFLDIFDTLGTLVAVSYEAGHVGKDGEIPRLNEAFLADSIATVVGACLGTNTTTTYVESAAGVSQGGRTGLTAFSAAFFFLLSLLFSPLFLAIPQAATAPALVLVGVMMLKPIQRIDLRDLRESIPAFVTIAVTPLAYSISDGIFIGLICYVLLNALTGAHRKVTPMMWMLALAFLLRYAFL